MKKSMNSTSHNSRDKQWDGYKSEEATIVMNHSVKSRRTKIEIHQTDFHDKLYKIEDDYEWRRVEF